MRRAELSEIDLDRLRDLAAEAGISLRLTVGLDGEATFVAGEVGAFTELAPLRRVLDDHMRAQAT